MSLAYRPDDPATLGRPLPLYRRMQDEDPAHWSTQLRAWVLTRYEDVRAACLDLSLSSDRLSPFFAASPEAARMAALQACLTRWMVFRDPPDHTRLRRLAAKVFNVRSIQALKPGIESTTQWLLERIGERESFDFVAEFASPLPALVIMDMLGVPREELGVLKALSDEMALFIGSARDARGKYDRADQATREMMEFFRALVVKRRAQPTTDLLSALVHLEDDGERLSEEELVAMCVLLLFAGHETTAHHIANGLQALLRFPEELERLRKDPSIAPAAVEELLRYDGPIGAQVRIVQAERELHGRKAQVGRPGVPDDERRQPRPARFSGPGPARPAPARRAAPHLRLRRSHLPRLSAGAPRRPGRAAGSAGALATPLAGER
jgi:cytochrome P450